KHAACCLLPCRRITNSKESGNSSSLQSGARAMVQLSLWGLLSKEREASLRQPLLRELLRLPVRVPSLSVASRLVMTRPVPPPPPRVVASPGPPFPAVAGRGVYGFAPRLICALG